MELKPLPSEPKGKKPWSLWEEQVGSGSLHLDLILSGSGVRKLRSWVLTEPRWSWPTLALLEAV